MVDLLVRDHQQRDAYEAGAAALSDLMERYHIGAEIESLQHLGFYRINYVPDIFAEFKDMFCSLAIFMETGQKSER